MLKMTGLRLAAILAGLIVLAAPVRADDHDGDHDRARIAREAGDVVPLDRVLAAVARDEQGKVIDVDLEREHGRFVYEVKLLTPDGRRRKVFYDAKSLERIQR